MKKSQPRVAIYYRTNHFNHMAPLQNLEAYARENGLDPIIYTDLASGVDYRPALNNLLKMVRSKKIDMIIVESITRFSRNPYELAAILSVFKKFNVKVILPNALKEVNLHE
jgi:DNA invertase Pin-like site-specific DNA recombinase